VDTYALMFEDLYSSLRLELLPLFPIFVFLLTVMVIRITIGLTSNERVFTDRAKAWADLLWIGSSSVSLVLLSFVLATEPPANRAKEIKPKLAELREETLSHANDIYIDSCGTEKRSENEEVNAYCQLLLDLIKGLPLEAGDQYVSVPERNSGMDFVEKSLKLKPPETIEGGRLQVALRERILDSATKYSLLFNEVRKTMADRFVFAIVQLIQLLFIHFVAIAAAGRFVRAWSDLNTAKPTPTK